MTKEEETVEKVETVEAEDVKEETPSWEEINDKLDLIMERYEKPAVATPLIYTQMAKVMADMGAVGKTKKAPSSVGGYAFRGIDDVMAALQPALIKHEVSLTIELRDIDTSEILSGGGKKMQRAIVTVAYTFWATDGSSVTSVAPGEGADMGDKSINKAMAGAMKYALTQTFCTPTEEKKDSEHDAVDLSGGGKRPKPRKQAGSEVTQETLLAAAIDAINKKTDAEEIRRFYAKQRGELDVDFLKELEEACAKRVEALEAGAE